MRMNGLEILLTLILIGACANADGDEDLTNLRATVASLQNQVIAMEQARQEGEPTEVVNLPCNYSDGGMGEGQQFALLRFDENEPDFILLGGWAERVGGGWEPIEPALDINWMDDTAMLPCGDAERPHTLGYRAALLRWR